MTHTQRFEGYGVLVTGATSGIGAATARRFAEDGAQVLVTDVDPLAAERTIAASGHGAVVNIGSVNGLQDFGNHAYSAAKAGLGSLTRTLAGHAAARGVRVNLVAPGTVRTTVWEGRDDELDATLTVDGGLTAVNTGFRRAITQRRNA